MRMLRFALVTPVLLVASFIACGPAPQPPAQNAGGPATAAPSATPAPSSASATPAVTASPSATAVTSAASSAPTATPRLRGVSTSPGQIGCGNVECNAATQLCCEEFDHKTGECVDKAAKHGCGTVNVLWKSCDEAADCGKGEVCCYVPRSDPSSVALNQCKKGSCDEGEPERCLPGSTCSKKGNRCKDLNENSEGYCH